MTRWQLALATALNVRPDEGAAVSLLALRSFFAGLCFVFFETAANTLFLSSFDIEALPYVYIAAAAVAATIGALYVRCERSLTPAWLFRATLVFVLASVTAFAAAYYIAPHRWLFAALMVWKDVLWMLLSLEFWGFAGCLFNVRQGKRLFPVAASGALVAGLMGGLMVGGLVKISSTGGLLVASVLAAALTLAMGIQLTRVFSKRLTVPEEEEDASTGSESLAAMLRRPYLRQLFGITMVSLLAYYALDYAFYERVEARHPEEAELATFFGYFFAFVNLANLLTSSLLSGRLMMRFGVGFALCAIPAVIGLGAALTSSAALLGLPVILFFWLLVGTKLSDSVLREAFEEPALRILYQPLPARERLAVQAKRESMVEPLSTGVCGVLLLVLTSVLGVGALQLLIALVVVCAFWAVLSGRLSEAYANALAMALSKRRLSQASTVPPDATTRSILERGLRSEQPAEAIYCFQQLEETGHPQLDGFLLEAVEHAHSEVRHHAIEQIERRRPSQAAPLLHSRLSAEESPAVRGSLARALCAVTEGDVPEAVFSCLDDPHHEVRRGAAVGLLRNGGIDGVVAAGTRLKEQLASRNPEDRRFGAETLGEARIPGFYRPLLQLIEDEDGGVRQAAVRAAGRIGNPRLVPAIVPLVSDSALREAAAAALVEFQDAALPELRKALEESDRDPPTLERLVRVVARIGGSAATGLLCEQTDHPMWAVQSAAYEALSISGYRAQGENITRIEASLLREAKRAAWCWSAFDDLSALEGVGIVQDALKGDIRRCEDNLLRLLSCLYPSAPVLAAHRGLRSKSSDARAQALEILDNLMDSGIRGFVVALLDDLSPDRRLTILLKHFPRSTMDASERLRQMLDARSQVGLWTRLCSLYIVGQLGLRSLEAELAPHLEDRLEVVRETARWAQARL